MLLSLPIQGREEATISGTLLGCRFPGFRPPGFTRAATFVTPSTTARSIFPFWNNFLKTANPNGRIKGNRNSWNDDSDAFAGQRHAEISFGGRSPAAHS